MGLQLITKMVAAQMTLHADSLKVVGLAELVITGTRTERDVASLPIPIQVISGKTIEKMGISRLNEVIQEQTGLLTIPDFGGGEGVQMQGLDAAYTMILIDGQPLVGRSAGTLDLSRLTVHNIERIEIVKGASSSLYGSEALAGVINIITKKIEKDGKMKGTANYRIARFGTHDISAGLQYGKNKVGIDVFTNYFSSQGYNLGSNEAVPTVAPFHNMTLQPKITFDISEKLKITANNRLYAQTQDYKAWINQILHSGKSNTTELNSTILLQQKISERWKIDYDMYATNYQFNEWLNTPENQRFSESFYNQWLVRPEIRSHYKIGYNTLTAGIGANYETLNRTYFSQNASLNSEYIFGQYEWFLKKRWNMLIGFRYDHHHQYQSQFSPKIGINYEVNQYLNVKTSVGYGYKAPDLRQLYFDFTNSSAGYSVFGYNVAAQRIAALQAEEQLLSVQEINYNTPLQPESSLNSNLGAFFQKGKWTADVNLFYNQIQNLIDTRAVARYTNGQSVFSYFNINKIFTYGTEINLSYKPLKNLTLTAGYQYLIAKDESVLEQLNEGKIFARNPVTLGSFRLQTEDYFGLYNRSRHLANFKINYEIEKWKTNVFARVFYRSRYGLFDNNNNAILDRYDTFVQPYFLMNVAVNQVIGKHFSAQIGVNNLLNFTDAANIPNIAGRQPFAKIQYNF